MKKLSEIPKFTLWLEFEQVDPSTWNIVNDFCNIHVNFEDGRHYGINIWTYKFLETSVNYAQQNGENLNGIYEIPPDLFVKELTRECIEKTITDLLKIGELEKILKLDVIEK